ncbi:MAG: 4-hydroxythreonine-4-phosphate dehydrogenase PdxA [Candidatus Kapabacteria bacterium]|nr:4-hydroxythreonine-4-phosphate dehydrogenase PdxA [Candidatus Kapabacteria bacterium]
MATPRIGITLGDVNGIGPEVMLKALQRAEVWDACQPWIIGPEKLAEQLRDFYTPGLRLPPVLAGGNFTPVELSIGRANAADAGKLSGEMIEHGVGCIQQGVIDAIVTMPISKAGLNAGGYPFPGHTEMLAALTSGTPLMILATEGLRVALATIHTPIANVPRLLTGERIIRHATLFSESLKNDFSIASPRIALLGLNPHAGEMGAIGSEEMETIIPALAQLQAAGMDASGPFPADGFFARYRPNDYDGVLAMYHDQGLIPLKMMARGGGVNITAGLPIVRTSPDHGTAYSLAGKNRANEQSSTEALLLAAAIVRARGIGMG